MSKLLKILLESIISTIPFLIITLPLWLLAYSPEENKEIEMPVTTYKEVINTKEVGSAAVNCEEETMYLMRTVAYCACEKCCGWNTGITYSGTLATQGRTVACNLDKFPIGTKLMIDGHEYIVEDTGSLSENMIDIYFESHEEALQYGSQWKAVEVIEQ